jgi:hypothetical protein
VFTATSTNGGASPVYQWKLNDVNVGTNNYQYSNASLTSNDVVKVEFALGDFDHTIIAEIEDDKEN